MLCVFTRSITSSLILCLSTSSINSCLSDSVLLSIVRVVSPVVYASISYTHLVKIVSSTIVEVVSSVGSRSYLSTALIYYITARTGPYQSIYS